ncbi:MAG: M48 family metalloprotease [Microcoleaceae cyanobacterium]
MIDNTSSATSDSVPEKPSLKAGLLALKQKDYPQAIAHLEIIAQQKPPKQKLKAQMGLVVAYQRTKQIDKAINLCRNLTQNSDNEIKTWASRNLQELLKRYPQKNSKKLTISAPTTPESSTQNQHPIETGFIPFNPNANKPVTSKNSQNKLKNNNKLSVKTGFAPLEKINTVPKVQGSKYSTSVYSSPPHKNNTAEEKSLNISTDKPAVSSQANNSISKNTKKSHQTSTNIPSNTPAPSPKLTWREAGRATGGRPLKSPNLTRFFLEQIVVAISIFWLSLTVLKFSLDATNDLLVWLPYCQPIQIFYRDPTQNFIIFLLGLFIFSPWLTDGLLILCYGLQNLPTTTLINHSKEANKLLRSFCQKRKIREIKLKILPIDVPIAFSYGWFARCFRFRIVVSQGLLDKLTEDEIATIYAREISHVQNRDFWLMSVATLMLQIPYTIYWQLTFWADWIFDFVNHRLPEFLPEFIKSFLPISVSGFRVLAAIISTLSYGLYWLLKLPLLWLSRRRIYYSDRQACNLTGNPNALTRAILQITIAMADDVQNQGKIRNLLESFEMLMPVGINQAISVGSIVSSTGFESIFNWDIFNPYRHWLEINNSHPLLGDRLKMLGLYADFWHLETELNLGNINADVTSKKQPISYKKENISTPLNLEFQKLLLQGAPFFGILIGLVFAVLLWLIGGISSAFGIWRLDWLWADVSILVGCLAIGFSIGILMRINHFFPDLKPTQLLQNPDLAKLLSDPETLPLDSQPIQLKGLLLGKKGIDNWLGQDLILQTTRGLVKLHYSSQLGPIGNLWPQVTRPSDLVGKSITATGWWRRGATPWIDIDNLQADNNTTSKSGHPIWSTMLAFTIAIWGTYMIYTGRF